MASLIPDIGNVSTNTTGAMQNYLGTVKATNDAIEKPTDILNTYIKNNLLQKQMEADMALKKEANDRAATELGMQQTERARINAERNATNTALQATINPDRYGATKMAGEQAGIAQSLANLSPEERAIAEQQIKANYDPEASKRGWLDTAVNAPGVDVGKVFEAKNKDYEMRAKTPGTPEYIAAQNAQFDLYKKEQAVAHANRLGEIGAQNAGQIQYLNAQADLPKIMVDPTTGNTKYIKPSEMNKYPNYIDSGVYSTQVANSRELQKQEYERTKNEQKITTDAKEKLAKTMGSLGNQNNVMASIGNVNAVAKSYGVNLSDVDVNTAIEGAIGGGTFDLGKPDADTDLIRQKLASAIATKTNKPLSEVLKKIEGTNVTESPVKPTVNTNNSTQTSQPFSLFGVTAPTEYNAVTNSNNYGIDPKEAALKAKYMLLPDYVKKDVSLSKYMDSPNSYESLLRK